MNYIYNDTLNELEYIIKDLRQAKDGDAYIKLNKLMSEINTIFSDIIQNITIFKENGVDASEEIILLQLENMMDGLQNKDIIKLADTLEYEIIKTIEIYLEILRENKRV